MPTVISAGVPTTAAFGIDPWTTAANPSSQIVAQSDDFKIVNLSKFPIFARIQGVKIADGGHHAGLNPGAPTLVQSAPSAAGQCQLAIKTPASAPSSFNTPADWMKSGEGAYSVIAGDKIDAAVSTGGTSLPLKVYGQMNGTGWAARDTFSVTPTFAIQAVAF